MERGLASECPVAGVELVAGVLVDANHLERPIEETPHHDLGGLLGLVIVVVGVGFAAYGVFCISTFTRRRLQAP